MTWNELRERISKMTPKEREETVCFITDYSGPDRRLVEVEMVQASEDVYIGISVGSECVLSEGQFYLTDPEDDVATAQG